MVARRGPAEGEEWGRGDEGLTGLMGVVSIAASRAWESAIVRLGHISDLHIADRSRYPRNGFTAKDCDRHSARLAKGLLDALREVGVDHLLVTGDLTLSAEPREFERAADLLRPWAEAGNLTVVPGNHDLWTEDSVDTGRFLRAIGPDGKGMRRPEPTYPHVARMPLADADQVIRLLAELPVAAVLHGHRHCAFRVDVPGVKGPVPILCAGSVSRVHDEPVRRARAYVYEVDAGGLRGIEALVSGTP